ncbi:MAG: DNA-3-methyladenine glycosylase [Anaerolineae bacterium]|nr:DNA-3-methyladenine glycosylase [Anaerolineae bacterium]
MVARALIGKQLVRYLSGVTLAGRIVEAEGYRGRDDAASHAAVGPTGRNFPMFGPPGHAYVYFIYGMHWMFNVAAHPEGMPGAVLIRALEPLEGAEAMCFSRGGRYRADDRRLTNGPARLAQAMAIDGTLNAADLCADEALMITEGELRSGEWLSSGPRVRVPGDERARAHPWRFWIEGNPYISS